MVAGARTKKSASAGSRNKRKTSGRKKVTTKSSRRRVLTKAVVSSKKKYSGFAAIPKPEFVFGLVGAIGTDLNLVAEVISEELETVGYETSAIRLTHAFESFEQYQTLPQSPADKRTDAYMTAGNGFREDTERGDAVALLGVAAIRERREKITGDGKRPDPNGRAYIVRSFKHPDEVKALRAIYGRAFYLVGAYASKRERLEKLTWKIAESHHDFDIEKYRGNAEHLMHRDEQEVSNIYGQNVRNTYPLSDIFVVSDKKSALKEQVNRFVEAIFENTFVTPRRDEQGMFFAHAAALRSADLNRQVGAAITTSEGEVLATGCNDVPKAGGGLYWCGDPGDARDFQFGEDISMELRKNMLAEIFHRLQEEGWLHPKRDSQAVDELVAEAISRDPSPVLKGSQLMSILEFGRTVHAEMAAITSAAMRGISLQGATLYTTTFPCHLCARHIVSSGISRVVYVEPYPKSKARQLYPDSISLELGAKSSEAVIFEPYVGFAPRQYRPLFEALDRKVDDGVKEWSSADAKPRLRRFVESYIEIETGALERLEAAITANKIRSADELGVKTA